MFWQNKEMLLSTARPEIETVVQDLVASGSTESTVPQGLPSQIMQTNFFLSTTELLAVDSLDSQASYLLLLPPSDPQPAAERSNVLIIRAHEGKKGQKQFLSEVLPLSMQFIEKSMENGRHVYVACQSGKDASVGVALAALQRFYGDDAELLPTQQWGGVEGQAVTRVYNLNPPDTKTLVTKSSIKTRLQWIIASCPIANPSRATLKRVNEYLLSPPAFYTKSST